MSSKEERMRIAGARYSTGWMDALPASPNQQHHGTHGIII